jgi:hypothetical protein
MAHTTRVAPLAPVTTHVTNHVMRPLAARLPGFAVLTHRGRKTGHLYRAPLTPLRRGEGYVFVLWYRLSGAMGVRRPPAQCGAWTARPTRSPLTCHSRAVTAAS